MTSAMTLVIRRLKSVPEKARGAITGRRKSVTQMHAHSAAAIKVAVEHLSINSE